MCTTSGGSSTNDDLQEQRSQHEGDCSTIRNGESLRNEALDCQQPEICRSQTVHRSLEDGLQLRLAPRVNLAHEPVVSLLCDAIPFLGITLKTGALAAHTIDDLLDERVGGKPLVLLYHLQKEYV